MQPNASANRANRVMESGDHSKNGASLKSLKSRGNIEQWLIVASEISKKYHYEQE